LRNSALVLLTLTCSMAFGQGYSLPGLQLVQPNPNSGRPMLVNTPCGSPENGMENWEIPILVYSDARIEHYVDGPCIIASVQLGFERSGKYDVRVYTFYKAKDGFCNGYPTLLSKPEFMRECRRVIYKTRRLSVDTRHKTMIVTGVFALDEEGRHLSFLPSDKDWHPIADLDSDPLAKPFRAAIDQITQLVEKKAEYFRRTYGGH
jgi:hypothetical protein